MLSQKLLGTNGESSPPVVLSYNGFATNTSNSTSYSGSINIGAAPSVGVDRLVVLAFTSTIGVAGIGVTNATINGAPATFYAGSGSPGGGINIGYAFAVVNSGTTASYSIAFPTSQQRFQIFSYSLTNVVSLPDVSQFQFTSISSGPAGFTSVSVSVATGGASIMVACVRDTSGAISASGQGVLTENRVNTLESLITNGAFSESDLNSAAQTYGITLSTTVTRAIGVLTLR